jgi:hypothetical protein
MQRNPIPNERRALWDIVIEKMKTRDQIGRKNYGTPLQPFNGRHALKDLSEELLDATVYLEQVEVELRELLTSLIAARDLISTDPQSATELLNDIVTQHTLLRGA